MKLLSVKKRKIAILFTAGLGDTLLFVPLLKELKRKNFHITCIFYSKYNNDCLLDSGLVDSKKYITGKVSLVLYALTRARYFCNIYINHLGVGNLINLSAFICSKRITKTSGFSKKGTLPKRIKAVNPNFSDAEQNLHLLYTEANAVIKNIADFYLPKPMHSNSHKYTFQINNAIGYFIIQVSAGNNTSPFKNWPFKNWLILIHRLCKTFTDFEFIIVGDDSETFYIKDLEDLDCINCTILIGKTTIEDVFNLTAKSNGYIGLDSGIMHMAVVLQKKTLTIFGASNEKSYGYGFLDPENQMVITTSLNCRPCSNWKNANTSRVTDPMQCPDFACLTLIEPDYIFKKICAHFKL